MESLHNENATENTHGSFLTKEEKEEEFKKPGYLYFCKPILYVTEDEL